MEIKRGAVTGIAGPSGSGKTMLLRSMCRLYEALPPVECEGQIIYNKKNGPVDMLRADDATINNLRRHDLGYVFQQSAEILNPSIRVGDQIIERLTLANRPKDKEAVLDLLSSLGLTPPERIYKSFPFQLSGGQIQRCLIAIALVIQPPLILADEPTSNLDMDLQQQITQLLVDHARQYESSLVIVSHNMDLLESHCDQIYYVKDGQLWETPPERNEAVDTIHNHDFSDKKKIVSITDLGKSYKKRGLFTSRKDTEVMAIDNFSIDIHEGEIVGIIGPSGSGKSTLAKIMALLIDYDAGTYLYRNEDVLAFSKKQIKAFRRECQIVFQDPLSALAPHRTVRQHLQDRAEAYKESMDDDALIDCLQSFALGAEILDRLPKELSGGQRQRVLIARALLLSPKLLICDEITSSLDEATAHDILNILLNLNKSKGLSVLFISHNEPLVTAISHRIIGLSS